jgi:hypothetical protein
VSGPAGAASLRPRLTWTADVVVVEATMPTERALRAIDQSGHKWVVIRRRDARFFYALTVDEVRNWPALLAAQARGRRWRTQPLRDVLDLHEVSQSTETQDENNVPRIDRSWRARATEPSIGRYVHERADGRVSVGYIAPGHLRRRGTRGGGVFGATPPPRAERPAADGPPVLEDEGTAPVRYPSIETDNALAPGAAVTFTVDLRQAPVGHTQGGAVNLPAQPDEWLDLELTVIVTSPLFASTATASGTVTVHRNAASSPAQIACTVRSDAEPGEAAPVFANFFLGTRFCGAAARVFAIAKTVGPNSTSVDQADSATAGTIVPQPAAEEPDVTVRVWANQQGVLTWTLVTRRFDGLPPQLQEDVTLKRDLAAEVTELFKRFATLPPGNHLPALQGFGTQLWSMAPRMFRDAYWALWDHYQRPLSFQFITNEPNLPWELMRPAREDESEIHEPIARAHPVARWLIAYDGYMRNQLPKGGLYTIAPKYRSVSRQLPRAQAESQALVDELGATPVSGTRAAVLALLETLSPDSPVAVLHFAGHGQFVTTATSESNIKLEDGALSASEVARPEVRLGKACRTLVFFNACEVGAAGTIFGEVGGWAAAFLSRQFGGFIAPLWSVEDEDASVVASELLRGVLTERRPVGEVMRHLRTKYGDASPTFYSYLYYGDVTARVSP